MQVKRDFERVYLEEADPWAIGQADSGRYNRYRELLLARTSGGTLLDIGCGLGAFLTRFRDHFGELIGVETSSEAVRRGRTANPGIEFVHAPAEELAATALDHRRFDAIVASDVLYYLDEAQRRGVLEWVGAHLADDGVALVAAWCPGGDYLEPREFTALVRRSLRVVHAETHETDHVVLVCERKRRLVALTFDYETWQPVPEGRRIDWDDDVFRPTARLLDAADRVGLPVTLFVELGEYFWLEANEPELARRMEEQWRDAVRRGHDVQLHLHPSWLPEAGARRDSEGWHWNSKLAKADAYHGDLSELVARCVDRLESILRPVDSTYAVTCFRAGAYQVQPFRRLAKALVDAGIICDSSVYSGGLSAERGYDYSHAYSRHQPYFASPWDPQLRAAPSEQDLVELPICVSDGRRVMLDGEEAEHLDERIVAALRADEGPSSERLRVRKKLGAAVGLAYARARPVRRLVNRVLPKRVVRILSPYGPDQSAQNGYFVAIGHTKGDLRPEAVAQAAERLVDQGFELVRLTDLALLARSELTESVRTREDEVRYQVAREYNAVLGSDRNEIQSQRLQNMIPLDREHVLDLGCGAGYWSESIARLYPWMHVVGVDVGVDFITAARARYASERVTFEVADFTSLPFPDETFDCIYADNTLEHAFDVDATLREAARVLIDGGALIAAIPSDARRPDYECDNHTWKTIPSDVRARLEAAGFTNIAIDEVDVYRRLGAPPFAPSDDRLMYLRAWKRARASTQLERAQEAMAWLYHRLDPARSSASNDAIDVIAGGTAFCAGYAVAIGTLLEREGYDVRWLAMEAREHPRGRGPEGLDTHVAVQARVDGKWMVLDAMAGTVIPFALREVLRQPELAVAKAAPDERYQERGYDLYDTAFWYSRVARYQIHRSVNPHVRLWRRNRQ